MKKNGFLMVLMLVVFSSANAASKEVEFALHDKWRDGNGKRIQWVREGNQIHYDTVCANLKKGSISYRDCRSTAKMYFRERCKELRDQGSRFCKAASSFNPL